MLVLQFSFHKSQKFKNHIPFMQLSVLMELSEKCMISILPYMKIICLSFHFWSTRLNLKIHFSTYLGKERLTTKTNKNSRLLRK